jgi:hypothetical protein
VQKRLLAIYLNDHLAGSTVGLELTRRTARENAGNPLGAFLSEVLVPEIVEDRETLRALMGRLGIPESGVKVTAGWLLEKLGRAKLNGEWLRYSPLSRLLELEGLAAGIEAKRAMWVALAGIQEGGAGWEGVDLQQLAQRAQSQRERLEEHRLAAAAEALR